MNKLTHTVLFGLALTALLPVALPRVAGATTWHVPSQHPTIQAGLDAASPGDTVMVACGTYLEHDIIMKAGVCLRSETGEADCVTIDAEREGRVLYCDGPDDDTRLLGFTITRGRARAIGYEVDLGGGMYWKNITGSPVVENCVFHNNRADGYGGGVHGGYSGTPVFINCEFTENESDHEGGGYFSAAGANGCSPTFIGCVFSYNDAGISGGGICGAGTNNPGACEVQNCTFTGNLAYYGGAIESAFNQITVTDCTFYENIAFGMGAGILVIRSADVGNCTFVRNAAAFGNSVRVIRSSRSSGFAQIHNTVAAYGIYGDAISAEESNAAILTCCNIFANFGGDWVGYIEDQLGTDGNISEDPLFCNLPVPDLTLASNSPCAPFSPPNPQCDLIGALPVACDQSTVLPTTWGAIKTMYR